jgi:hypothetical protein
MKQIAMVAALALAGCVTVDVGGDKSPAQVNHVRDANYTIGVERTVVVGDPIVRVRDYSETVTEVPSMEATETFRLLGGPVAIAFQQGERLPIYGQRTNNGVTYTVAIKDGLGIQIAPDGTIGAGIINGLGTDAQVVMVYHYSPSSATARFNRVVNRRTQRTQSGQNFEIVFNGIDGQAMHFQYREYTGDDFIRPAFSQDLSYPLRTNTIRFRDMVMAVSSADAQQIRYTVVSEGGNAH